MLYLDIIFIIVLSLYLYWLWGLLRALASDAPFVPMNRKVVEHMMALVEAKPGDLWVDLGSGDGRVLVAAARRFGVRGLGIERIGALRILSRIKIALAGFWKTVRIRRGDFFRVDVSSADIVSFYLLPDTSARLIEKLRRELRPGTTIIFHRYPIPNLPLVAEDPHYKIYAARI